jgi:hypothetical protein
MVLSNIITECKAIPVLSVFLNEVKKVKILLLQAVEAHRGFSFNLCGGTLGTTATYWPTVPAPDDR